MYINPFYTNTHILMEKINEYKPLQNLAETIDIETNENRKRTGMSKYDFVPVKVTLNSDGSFFILSRLIILRMFCVIGVHYYLIV